METAHFHRRDAFVACSVLKESLEPLSTADGESPLRILPAAVLTAMRGTYFGDVVDPSPWLEGKILLPPQMCLRAYQLEEYAIDDDDSDPTGGPFGDVELANPFKRKTVGKPDDPLQLLQVVTTPRSVRDFVGAMEKIRTKCETMGWVPLYHYTVPAVAPFILQGGFRMSTQGQGDGGVYFSTLGPASYDLGTSKYEENIIVDCFGRERLEEYRGKHKLDVW